MAGLDRLLELAKGRGGRIAVRDGTRSLSYGELAASSARLAGALAGLGLRRGDRVAFWLPNCAAYLQLFFACARLGVIAVAVNTRFRSAEVGDIIGRSGARALVLWPGFHGIPFAGILEGIDPAALSRVETIIVHSDPGETPPASLPLRGARLVGFEEMLGAAPLAGDGGREDGAAIFTTSGTTKAPKFVLHRQRSLIDHAAEVAPAFGYDQPGERVLQAIPFCGVFGFAQALGALHGGAELDLLAVFDEALALEKLARGGITQFNGADDMAMRLLGAARGARPFPALRFAGFAAFAHDPAVVVAAGDARGMRLLGLYGMSEVQALYARQSESAPAEERAKAGGRPVAASARARVRDPDSGEILPAGQAGELELKGPSVMAEYFGDAAATRAAFTADGYLKTGDLARMEPDGRFTFLTRMGDVMRLGGFLVSPAEIEAEIAGQPGIAAAQVVAAATSAGPRAVAFVLLDPGARLDEAALQAHCRVRLAAFKIPARVIALDAFPVTESANGVKIQRARLRQMAEAALAAG
ncbi:MAG: AMP-binding protein [Alphaproteobacteria bacterium]|nr:AMP-binding protein [Alphaproteobacteria bacterium]